MPYAIFVSKRGKPKAAGLPRIWLNGREVGKTEVAVRNDIERCWENDGKMLVDNIEPLSQCDFTRRYRNTESFPHGYTKH